MSDLRVHLSVPFPSDREAEVAYQVLRVDKEPSRGEVTKQLKLNNNILEASFSVFKYTHVMEHTPAPYGPRAVYGYAMYIGSNMLFLLYVIWAIIPDDVLHDYLGLTYWPSKYWAVAIPIWALTALATFAFLIYPAINMSITPDIDDIRTITDKYALQETETTPGGIPSVSDIPITEVCRRLYLRKDNS